MRTTGKCRNSTSTGTSTGPTLEWSPPSVQSKIALALLRQAVMDLAGKDLKLRVSAASWLNGDGAKEVCVAIPFPYEVLWEEIRDITFRPYAQRLYLARKLVKSFPAR